MINIITIIGLTMAGSITSVISILSVEFLADRLSTLKEELIKK